MANEVKSIGLDKLVAHPGNANVMSKTAFGKLAANIERTGLYEPVVVRRHRQRRGYYELINGHHRCRALKKLGYETVDCVVWDVDDEQTEILLATLNRLCGRDRPTAKIALLNGLKDRMGTAELGKLLPMSRTQIERLCRLKERTLSTRNQAKPMAEAMVFFVSAGQKKIIEEALRLAQEQGVKAGGDEEILRCAQNDRATSRTAMNGGRPRRAAKRTAALTAIAQRYVKTAYSVPRTAGGNRQSQIDY